MEEAEIRELLSLQKNLNDIKDIEKTKAAGISQILNAIENLAKLDTSIANLKSSIGEIRKAIEAKIDESNKAIIEQINKLSEEIKKIKITSISTVNSASIKTKESRPSKVEETTKVSETKKSEDMTPEELAKEFIRKFKPVVGRKITITDIEKVLDISNYPQRKKIFDILKKKMTIAPNGIITKMNNK